MTRITSSDQVLLLLRSHLDRAQGNKRKKTAAAARGATTASTRLQRVQRMANDQALSNSEIRRSLLAGMLAEEFGDAVVNDSKFQQMVDDVLRVVEQDERGRTLLDRAVTQLISG